MESQTEESSVTDLSPQLTMVSLYSKIDPSGFHRRLQAWCVASGLQVDPTANTHALVTLLDDERLISLGAKLRAGLRAEVQRAVSQEVTP